MTRISWLALTLLASLPSAAAAQQHAPRPRRTETQALLARGADAIDEVDWRRRSGALQELEEIARDEAAPMLVRLRAIETLGESFSGQGARPFVTLACEPGAQPAIALGAMRAAMFVDADRVRPGSAAALRDAQERFCRLYLQRPSSGPTHPAGFRVAGGGAIEPAFALADDDDTLILGLGLSVRLGLRFPNHMAILVMGSAVAQVLVGDQVRSYYGVGPALMFDAAIPAGATSAIHLGIGNGFQIGESTVTQEGVQVRASGVFPTVHAYLQGVMLGFAVGLHVQVAIPPDDPGLTSFTIGIMIGGEAL